MKEDIKNVQSLQVNLEGEDFVFNRFGNMFVFNEDSKVETVDGSFSSNRNIQLSEDAVKNLDYTVLTYTEEYKQKLEDEYEATLQNKVDDSSSELYTPKQDTSKKRVRKYNQIARQLQEYQIRLNDLTTSIEYDPIEMQEEIAVLSNMIILLRWVLKMN